jgi:ssDNA-binding Zn-finger/Zn-ribbon topoisomerase 1
MSTNPSQQRSPGIPCPQCNFFIEMSIQNLLYQASFQCPGCLLTLSMDRNQSKPALEVLQKVHREIENLEKHKRFDL